MIRLRGAAAFWGFVAVFVANLAAFYPITYAIEDEFNILSLAVAISRGTVLIDRAGLDLDADLLWNGHRISKFSPFHAALFVPAVLTEWRAAFAVTAAFTVWGAFIVRGMLRREGLADAWVALYFLCAGLWFYSRTLMAAVPASVLVLAGASLLLRDRSRPFGAGIALSAAGLCHPWMIPVSAALVAGWLADAPRERWRGAAALAAGAAPGAAMLLAYNAHTTGSHFSNVYSLLGTQYGFRGEHVATFLPLYAVSLLVMPLAGWAALSRRWSRGFAVPCAVTTVVVMASLYYYRDGMGYGIAGFLPAQRFLLPASLLACVPAARFLSSRAAAWGVSAAAARRAVLAGLVACAAGSTAVSLGHQAYLRAHESVQQAIRTTIPDGSRVVLGERAFKEFAPVLGTWRLRQMRNGRVPDAADREGAYTVWIGLPGSHPPPGWMEEPILAHVPARSWVWRRDVWIAGPFSARKELD